MATTTFLNEGHYQQQPTLSQVSSQSLSNPNALKVGLGFASAATGLPSEIGMAANYGIDVASGNPNATRNLAKSAIGYGAREVLAEPVAQAAGLPGMGALSLGVDIAKEAMNENPDYERATVGSVGSTIGGVLGAPLGPLGSFLGSVAGRTLAREQYANGAYGDWRDARTFEEVRDFYEDRGMSRKETKEMAAGIAEGVRSDIRQFNHMEKMKQLSSGSKLGSDISNDYSKLDGIDNGARFSGWGGGGEGGFGGGSDNGGDFGSRESKAGGMGGV